MSLVSYDLHSFDVDRLQRGGWIIDVGCRNFIFTRMMLEQGFKVFAMDADPTMPVPDDLMARPDFRLCRAALVGNQTSEVRFAMDDGDVARHVVTPEMSSYRWPVVTVPALTLPQVLEMIGVQSVEGVKIDCEGSEYEILKRWPGPVAKQLSVEYHEHTCANPGGWPTYVEILKHMGQWYECPNFVVPDPPVGTPPHIIDVFFVLRS